MGTPYVKLAGEHGFPGAPTACNSADRAYPSYLASGTASPPAPCSSAAVWGTSWPARAARCQCRMCVTRNSANGTSFRYRTTLLGKRPSHLRAQSWASRAHFTADAGLRPFVRAAPGAASQPLVVQQMHSTRRRGGRSCVHLSDQDKQGGCDRTQRDKPAHSGAEHAATSLTVATSLAIYARARLHCHPARCGCCASYTPGHILGRHCLAESAV